MEAIKPNSTKPVQTTQAIQRAQATQAQQEKETQAAAANNASKAAAYEQPKPTTNTRGEKLGQRLNAIA